MNLKDVNIAKALKGNMHICFDSPQGKEIMKFLEGTCCWYESPLMPGSNEHTLINVGKREVLASIKTILKLSPEQISALVRNREE